MSDEPNPHPRPSLTEIAAVFLRLSVIAFGGPAVHIGMMEDAVVHRRKWLDRQHFLDLISAINFIPGPNSTELAIALGYVRAGLPGLAVAGACFITPAAMIVLPFAWAYVEFGSRPQMASILQGISAAVLAVVAVALVRFAKTGIRDTFTLVIAIAAMALELAILRWLPGITPEIPVLLFAALLGLLKSWRPRSQNIPMLAATPLTVFLRNPELWRMVLAFLKIGATLFGSGYVLLSYLQSGFVDSHHWLTRQQMMDALAVGQFTPGPVLTTATFIGYLLGAVKFGGGVPGGIIGAMLATIAIFLPSFIFTAMVGRLLDRVRKSPLARGALDAMNAAVVSLIAVTVVRITSTACHQWWTTAVAGGCLVVALKWKVNPTWLIIAGAIAGVVQNVR
jgi:chromate transporter